MLIRYNDIKRLTIKAAIKAAPAIMLMLSVLLVQSCCRRHRTSIEDSIELSCSVAATTKAPGGLANSLSEFQISSWNGGGNNRVGFGVFGYKKNVDNSSTRLFNDVTVLPTDATCVTWQYTPVRYWDSNPLVSYQFIAYWPHLDNPDAPTVSETDKVLTISDIPNWQDGDENAFDFMTAKAIGKYKSADANDAQTFYANNGKVSFTFYHILAKLVVKAYYTGDIGSEIKVKKLALKTGGSNEFLADGSSTNYSQPFNERKSYDEPYYGAHFNGYQFTGTTPAADNPFGTPSTSTNTPNGRKLFPYGNSTTPHAPISDDAFWEGEGYEKPEPDVICEQLMVPCGGWQNLNLYVEYSIDDVDQTPVTINNISFSTTLTDNDNHSATYDYTTFGNHSYVIVLMFNSDNNGVEVQSIIVEDWIVNSANNFDTEVYNW